MIIAARIKKLLDAHKLAYRVFSHIRFNSLGQATSWLGLDPARVLACQILADRHGLVMVVYPLSTKIDFERLRILTHRNLKVITSVKVNRIFSDCDAGCWPPLGQAYRMDVIIDRSITRQGLIYFASGSSTAILQLQAADFLHLNSRARLLDIVNELSADDNINVEPIAHVLENVAIPELPPVACKILQLLSRRKHSTAELIELISQDQLIQQQLMLYAQLPFMQPHSVEPADNLELIVNKVLGFDMVSHIALGVAVGRAFSTQHAVVDATDFWRHAFYAAAYAQRITQLVNPEMQLDPAISYLAGMFHNFGLLIFSQMFPPEYRLLKKWMILNPKVSIAVLEKRLLGMGQAFNIVRGGHAQMGEWLLRHWQMPESICVIAKEHHSLLYKGVYAPYVRIIQITNQLLREDGIGDGSAGGLSEQLLEPLGLSTLQVIDNIQDIRAGFLGLDQMAFSLSNSPTQQ